MMGWELLGPKIPVPVWKTRLLRAVGMKHMEEGIQWEEMSRSSQAWADLDADLLPAEARVLLLLHGTGMRTQAGFRGFTVEDFDALNDRYKGRILAFEHPALSQPLPWNARALSRLLLQGGVKLHLDVIGLSRGGLLGRYLAEGWEDAGDRVRVDKLVFLGTPNDGTPSARRDPVGAGAKEMKAWRVDVRRVALVGQAERDSQLVKEPFALRPFEPLVGQRFGTWPMFRGSIDQLPNSPVLQRLNGFLGEAPGKAWRTCPPRYYGVASVFTFDHGVPNPCLVQGAHPMRRSDAAAWALPVPNDLVVPTISVYAPAQGPHATGLFPLEPGRLMVLGPSSNATHTGMIHLGAVRRQVLQWLCEA